MLGMYMLNVYLKKNIFGEPRIFRSQYKQIQIQKLCTMK